MNWCGATASWGRLNPRGGDAYMVSFESTFKEMRVLTCHSKEMRVQNCHFLTFVFGDASAYLSLSVAITNWDPGSKSGKVDFDSIETCFVQHNRDLSCPTQSRHVLSNSIEACFVQHNRDVSCPTQSRHVLSNAIEAWFVQCNRGTCMHVSCLNDFYITNTVNFEEWNH